MAEEMFNEDQRGHMFYLSSLPPEKVCACGWWTAKECNHTGSNCPGALAKGQREAARYRVWSGASHTKRIEWAAMDRVERDAALDAELASVSTSKAR